jgi:hypothetical protein
MQVYDFTVTTTAPQSIGAPGRYIKYLSGNAGGNDPTLYVQGGRNGEKAILLPGQALTFPKSWNDFTLSNYAGVSTITGKVLIGDGRMDDATLQGVVQVVDGGKGRTLSNTAFTLASYSAAVAGQYSRLQLWNPATSPNRLVIEAITLWSTTGSNLTLNDSTVQLASLYDTGRPKKLGGTASAASAYYDSTAAAQAISGLSTYPVVAAQLQTVKLNEPIIVPPGHGLMVAGNVLNNQIQVNWEWYEEANV